MPGILNTTDTDKKLQEAAFPKYIAHLMKNSRYSKRQLSESMGRGKSYLQHQTSTINPTVGLLLLLSQHLHTNLFDYFINQLPENLRITKREADLQQQLAALQQQLDSMTKERDLYKQVAMK